MNPQVGTIETELQKFTRLHNEAIPRLKAIAEYSSDCGAMELDIFLTESFYGFYCEDKTEFNYKAWVRNLIDVLHWLDSIQHKLDSSIRL